MLPAERVLLYALALSLGALLIRELTRPVPVSGSVAARPLSTAAPSTEVPLSEITLKDAVGTPRLSLSLNSDGSPRLVMNDMDGRPGVELSLSNEGLPLLQISRGEEALRCGIDALGSISLQMTSGETRQQMIVQSSGAAEWRISGKATDPEVVMQLDPNGKVSWEFLQVGRSGRVTAAMDRTGQAALQLIGERKTFAQLLLASSGEVEIGVGGGTNGIEALLRTDHQGAAEIALTAPDHAGGPRMSMLPSGEMGVRVLGREGHTGPVMQLLKDGSAEVTIVDARSQRGPVMFRGNDGTSLIGIRGEKGKPGPRLFQGADLKSLIALPGLAMSHVGMYADPTAAAFLVVTGADGKPVALLPSDASGRVNNTESAEKP